MNLLFALGGSELILLLGFIPFVLNIIATVSILKSKWEGSGQIVWLLVTWLIPFGWLIYFLVGKNKRIG